MRRTNEEEDGGIGSGGGGNSRSSPATTMMRSTGTGSNGGGALLDVIVYPQNLPNAAPESWIVLRPDLECICSHDTLTGWSSSSERVTAVGVGAQVVQVVQEYPTPTFGEKVWGVWTLTWMP